MLLITACTTLPCGSDSCPIGSSDESYNAAAPSDTAIHDYILAHGDVILQALQENQKRQQAARLAVAGKAIAENKAALFDDARDGVAGNPKGDVTVVEFFDNECPYCKKVAPDLEKLIAADKGVRVVYKEFPILGPMSVIAAKAALASQGQGKFVAFHRALMADKTAEHQLTETHLLEIAGAVGLDIARLRRDMAAPEIQAQLDATIALARKIGITGTPGLIVGDSLTPGALPYEALVQAVAAARGQRTAAGQ